MLEHRHTCVYNTPEDNELREGGYLERAKVLALREMNLKAQKTQTLKEAKDNGL